MLQKSKAFSSFSVDAIERAKAFYHGKLGITVTDGPMGVLELHVGGGTPILVYPKGDTHIPATYTVLNFPVEDIDQAVDGLSAIGITFEQYDDPIKTDPKGISRNNSGPNIAWFKDPAGNILSIIEE